MAVPRLLLETLENLTKDDLTRFQWELVNGDLESFKPIPRSRLENASQMNTVDTILRAYGEKMSVHVTVEILKKMTNNNAAEKLKNKYAAGGAPSSTSTS